MTRANPLTSMYVTEEREPMLTLRTLIAVLPTCLVLALSGAQGMVPSLDGIRDAFDTVGQCANQRMMDAAAVADGGVPSPGPEPWSVPLRLGRSIESLSHSPVSFCGRTVEGTIVHFSDGTTTTLPGQARLVTVTDDEAEFLVS